MLSKDYSDHEEEIQAIFEEQIPNVRPFGALHSGSHPTFHHLFNIGFSWSRIGRKDKIGFRWCLLDYCSRLFQYLFTVGLIVREWRLWNCSDDRKQGRPKKNDAPERTQFLWISLWNVDSGHSTFLDPPRRLLYHALLSALDHGIGSCVEIYPLLCFVWTCNDLTDLPDDQIVWESRNGHEIY